MVTFIFTNYELLTLKDIHVTNTAHIIAITIFYTHGYTCTSDFNFDADRYDSHYSNQNDKRISTISTQTHGWLKN